MSIVDLPCVCSMAIENAMLLYSAGSIRRRSDSKKSSSPKRSDDYHKMVNIRRKSPNRVVSRRARLLVVLFQASACLWQAKPAASGVSRVLSAFGELSARVTPAARLTLTIKDYGQNNYASPPAIRPSITTPDFDEEEVYRASSLYSHITHRNHGVR